MLMFVIVLGGCAWIFSRLPSSFLPQEDQGVLMTIVQLPNGATTARTEEVIHKIEDYYLEKEKDAIQDVFAVSGFSFVGQGQNYALVFAKLKDFDERTTPELAANAIVQRAMGYFFTLRDSMAFPLQPPAIPGLGTSSGFSMYLVDSGNTGTDRADRCFETADRHGQHQCKGQLASAPTAPMPKAS